MKNILLVALVAACGGGSGSGVDSGKKLADLTASEWSAECNYLYDTYPKVTITCTDSTTRSRGEDPSKRATACSGTNDVPTGCTLTVGQAEACIQDSYDETDAEQCSASTSIPASCAPVISPACQGAGRIAPMTRDEVLDLALHFAR